MPISIDDDVLLGCKRKQLMFSHGIGAEDLSVAKHIFSEHIGEVWGIAFNNVVFETEVLEMDVARLVCANKVSKFFFSKSIMKRATWDVYFKWMSVSEQVTQLSLMHYEQDRDLVESFVEFLPRMRLKILYMFRVDITGVGDRLFTNVCGTVEILTVKQCGGVSGECPRVSISSVLGEERGRKYKLLNLDVECQESIVDSLPGLLVECNRLFQLTISKWAPPPVSRVTWGDSYRELAISIWAHTQLKNIFSVNEFNNVIHRLLNDKRRPMWQSVIAFMNVRIKRLSSRSAMGRLFFDADRLIWKCLI